MDKYIPVIFTKEGLNTIALGISLNIIDDVKDNYSDIASDGSDGDLVDYFYDDIFNNELKPKGLGNKYTEYQTRSRQDIPSGYLNPSEVLIVRKIQDIIKNYNNQ
jgi:hypothetical protein